jgi:hypothetical protein
MDQRLSGSLSRFLQRQAIQRVKNPRDNQHPPWGWYWKIRFKFALRKRALIIHGGIFGLQVYWGDVGPMSNNVGVDQKRWGVILYPIFRVVPGASYRCFKWLKTETMDAVEEA